MKQLQLGHRESSSVVTVPEFVNSVIESAALTPTLVVSIWRKKGHSRILDEQDLEMTFQHF